jgi:hypothetical protein
VNTTTLAQIEAELDAFRPSADGEAAAKRLLGLAEAALEHWVAARGQAPTAEEREGFRLLALHRQGTSGVPSFNACRETCREIAYHYNVLTMQPDAPPGDRMQVMMAMLVKHLALFVAGKMQVEGLGEFCCASRPLRTEPAAC